MNPFDTERRQALAALAAVPMWSALPAWGQVPTDRITVLYRRESVQAPGRLEPLVQDATLALEREFIGRGFRVIQPSAETYRLLDQGAGVIVTFAEDAGFSLVFSAYADMRAAPGQADAGIAEVRLSARVFVGRNILVAEEGRGQMFTRLEAGQREFGMRRGMQLAAQRAASDLADKAARPLRELTGERLTRLLGTPPSAGAAAQVVDVASDPARAARPGAPAAAPPPAAVAADRPPPSATAGAPAAPSAPAAPAGLPPPRQRWALLVGMSDYSGVRAASGVRLEDLPGVARDTTFVENSIARLGFAKDRTVVLRDARATGANVRGVLKDLAARAQPEDVILIFMSAHGGDKDLSATGFGMPILADFRPNDPAALDFWELQSFARNMRARVLWVNDTCHSGGAATNVASVVVGGEGVRAALEVRGPEASAVAGQASPGQDFAILTSCAPSEIAWETSEGGLFTTRLFNQLVANQGQLPLAQVYARGVHQHVVDTSRQICAKAGACAKYPQQTPRMAYSGNGHLIRI